MVPVRGSRASRPCCSVPSHSAAGVAATAHTGPGAGPAAPAAAQRPRAAHRGSARPRCYPPTAGRARSGARAQHLARQPLGRGGSKVLARRPRTTSSVAVPAQVVPCASVQSPRTAGLPGRSRHRIVAGPAGGRKYRLPPSVPTHTPPPGAPARALTGAGPGVGSAAQPAGLARRGRSGRGGPSPVPAQSVPAASRARARTAACRPALAATPGAARRKRRSRPRAGS